jgi:hypothetical protein
MNDRECFGKIVASYKFTSGGSDAISTATLATSAGAKTLIFRESSECRALALKGPATASRPEG